MKLNKNSNVILAVIWAIAVIFAASAPASAQTADYTVSWGSDSIPAFWSQDGCAAYHAARNGANNMSCKKFQDPGCLDGQIFYVAPLDFDEMIYFFNKVGHLSIFRGPDMNGVCVIRK
jgi:hypothetical protein